MSPSSLPATRVYREYPSTQDPSLRLFANFITPPEPRPILVSMHGWHGEAKHGGHPDNVVTVADSGWFLIEPDMRGRGDSTGHPDCNGWELQDVVDAVTFALREYAGHITSPDSIYLTGGSGGGGNVLGLLGKFPDRFCTAVCEACISDYGRWHEHDSAGEFRDEMEGKSWVGGSPATRPEAYASRGGFTTVGNLLTPLAMTHGELDSRCPVEQARRYLDLAERLGTRHRIEYFELLGVAATGGHFGGITPEQEARRQALIQRQLAPPRQPVILPRRGRMTVAGYLKTRAFEVIFDSIDSIGTVTYDLDHGTFAISARTATSAVLRVRQTDSAWRETRVKPGQPDQNVTPRNGNVIS